MSEIKIQIIAGVASTFIFIGSNVPMLVKALVTKDLRSYSPGQIGLANLGNFLHWLYIASLPVGPVWFLHGFNTLVALLMLGLYLRYEVVGNGRLHNLINKHVNLQKTIFQTGR